MSYQTYVETVGLSTTTVLDTVDLKAGKAIYKVITYGTIRYYTPSITRYTKTLKTVYTVITAIIRSYILPDGKVYTVETVPTEVTIGSTVITIGGRPDTYTTWTPPPTAKPVK